MGNKARQVIRTSFILGLSFYAFATHLRAQGITSNPLAVTFAGQLVGTSSPPQAVTLTNAGTAAVTILSVSASAQFSASSGCNGKTLAKGATCAFNTTFKPTAAGAAAGMLTISFSAPTPSITVPLSGTGLAPIATLSQASVSFGSAQVGSTVQASPALTLSNTGTAALVINGVAIPGEDGSFSQTNTCGNPSGSAFPSTLPIAGSCTILPAFTPRSTGLKSAQLVVKVAGPATSAQAMLSGTGVAPSATLTPATVPFGNQLINTSVTMPVTLTNTGIGPLAVGTIHIGSLDDPPLHPVFTQTNNCGTSLGVGGFCTITVAFNTPTTGAKSLTLYVPTAAGTKTATLTGTGVLVVPPVITSFTAAAASVKLGTSTTLLAVFSGGAGTTGSVDNGIGVVSSGVPVTVTPATTTAYNLTVTNTAGTVTATATVSVSVSTTGSNVVLPPTFTVDSNVAALNGPTSINNFNGKYLGAGFAPMGGAKIDIGDVPQPTPPLNDYEFHQLRGTTITSTATATVSGATCNQFNYTDTFGPLVYANIMLFCPSTTGVTLYKIHLAYNATDPAGPQLVADFQQVLSTIQFNQ